MKQMSFSIIPEIDEDATLAAVLSALKQYRMRKYCDTEQMEPVITPSYEPRYHGATNVTSDQTANIAIHNTYIVEMHKFCRRIEQAVEKLQPEEKLIIQERYMKDYAKDYQVYNFVFNPPISHNTYRDIRRKALIKLAHGLSIVKFRQNKCKKKYEKGTLERK